MYRYIIKVSMYSFPIVVECFGYPCGLYTLLLEIQKNIILQRKKKGGSMLLYFPLNSFLPKNLIGLYWGLLSSNQLQGAFLEVKQHCRRHQGQNQDLPDCPSDSHFLSQNWTGSCWPSGGDVSVYECYWYMYKYPCPISWVCQPRPQPPGRSHDSWEDLNCLHTPLLCPSSFCQGEEASPGYLVIPILRSWITT